MLMTADTFKMGTLIGLIFCTLIMGGKIMIVESAVYSSPDAALKFSQCLIEKMRESPFFTVDDENSMFEVQDVMAQALLKKEHSLLSAKILVNAFITSLADIIIDSDVSRNTYRKGIYFSALEQCSLSSTGYTDVEFLREAQRILTVIETNKALKYGKAGAFSEAGIPAVGTFGSVGYSQASGVGNPFAVHPTPVQNRPASQYFHSDGKTIFEQQEKPYSPPIASSAQIPLNPQYPVNPSSQFDLSSRFGTRFQSQSGNVPQAYDFSGISQTGSFSSSYASSQYQNFPVVSDASRTSQSEKGFLGPHAEKNPYDYNTGIISETGVSEIRQPGLGSHSGSAPYVYDTGGITKTDIGRPDVLSYAVSPQIGQINEGSTFQTSTEGLNIPQTKESSVVAIPPKINQQFISDEHFSQNPEQGADEEIYLPPNQKSASKSEISESSISSSMDMHQAHEQYPDYTSYSELESIVMNILTASPKFRKAFNSEISEENAIHLARALTEQTFADYNLDVMNDALSVVTEEIAKVRVPSPETFAFALSNALIYVLKRHESSLSPGQSQLAASFLSSLDNSGQFHSHREIVEKEPEYYNTGVTLEQSSFDNSGKSYSKQETFEKEPEDYNTGITLEQSSFDNSGKLYTKQDTFEKESQDYNTSVTLEQSRLDNSQQFYSQQYTVENQSQDYSTGVTLEQSSLDNSDQNYSEQETAEKDYQYYNIDVTLEQLYPQQEILEKQPQDYQAGEAVYSEFNEKQTDFDFQSPPLSPEDRKGEIFSLSLSRYLSNSDAIRNFFCYHNEPDDVIQISFSIIKASLTEYGMHVASLAASVASGALTELSKEGLCNNYAKTISEIIAEILEESEIKDPNFERIARKMEQNLIQRQITPTESQKPPAALENLPPRVPETETYEAVPNLEPSFTLIPNRQAKTEDPDIITPSDYKDVPDYQYTHPVTSLQTSTSLSTARPTVHSADWAPDGTIDQKTFTDYLTEKFYTLLSYDSKESEGTYTNSEETSSTTKIVENQESGGEFSEELSQEPHRRRKGRKGKKKEKITTPQPDIVTTCSEEEDEEYEEVYNPATTEDEYKILYHQDDDEILQEDVGHRDSTESDVKTTSVELQPSFQGPVLDSEYATASFQPNFDVRPSDSDHTDPSLALAKKISEIAASASVYIRSENFDRSNLCAQIKQLAPLVNIPELDYCRPIATVDYLLNVLYAAVRKLKGV